MMKQKHTIMGLQKISIDPQAVHTKAHIKENLKKFLESCGQKYGVGLWDGEGTRTGRLRRSC